VRPLLPLGTLCGFQRDDLVIKLQTWRANRHGSKDTVMCIDQILARSIFFLITFGSLNFKPGVQPDNAAKNQSFALTKFGTLILFL